MRKNVVSLNMYTPSAVIARPSKLSDIGVSIPLPPVKCFYNFFQALAGLSRLQTVLALISTFHISLKGAFFFVFACFADWSRRHLSKSSLCLGGRQCDVIPPEHLGNPGVYVRVCLDEDFHRHPACPVLLRQLRHD